MGYVFVFNVYKFFYICDCFKPKTTCQFPIYDFVANLSNWVTGKSFSEKP